MQSEPTVSITIDEEAKSLAPESAYSPDLVRRLIRRTLIGWGLGRKDIDVPLADIIPQGSVVLVKPNWVVHYNSGGGGFSCLYTHPAFVLTAIREVAATRPCRIIVGDAPIQGCNFDAIVDAYLRREIASISHESGTQIDVVDFRRTIMTRGKLNATISANMRELARFVLFDLGQDSLLEPVTDDKPRFRVADYDPHSLARTHCRGRHQYLLCKEAFEADVVISLPKLKTHCKAGLTGALKNLVGLNGNKDYLPHYRVGGSVRGGDNYEGNCLLRRLAEFVEDKANQQIGERFYPILRLGGSALRRLSGNAEQMGGGWYGNDTVWRMVLDLVRILIYGRPDGTMSDSPQRTLFSLTDAIVCGQGDGPLRPVPLSMGSVTFGASPVACDFAHAAMLCFDADRIPLLRESTKQFRWPLVSDQLRPIATVNGRQMPLDTLMREFGLRALPPKGWRGHVEARCGDVKKRCDRLDYAAGGC